MEDKFKTCELSENLEECLNKVRTDVFDDVQNIEVNVLNKVSTHLITTPKNNPNRSVSKTIIYVLSYFREQKLETSSITF